MPGNTLRTVVQLSSVYNMTQSGDYAIQYKMDAAQVLFRKNSVSHRRVALSNEDQRAVIQSIPIVVFSVGHRNRLIEQANRVNTQSQLFAPTYISCSTSQSGAIVTAIKVAQSYSNNAVQYLANEPAIKKRYTTWFGPYSYPNWLTLRSHFTKILDVLNNEVVSFDCECSDGSPSTYAYVYTSRHYIIYLCELFWSASTSGVDSQGGTIIHELAHFNVVAGTDDHAYGHDAAKSLALTDPTMALSNSDNLQYFAENNPTLV